MPYTCTSTLNSFLTTFHIIGFYAEGLPNDAPKCCAGSHLQHSGDPAEHRSRWSWPQGTAKRWEEKLANKRVMTVLVLYAADCSSTVGACDIPCHNSTWGCGWGAWEGERCLETQITPDLKWMDMDKSYCSARVKEFHFSLLMILIPASVCGGRLLNLCVCVCRSGRLRTWCFINQVITVWHIYILYIRTPCISMSSPRPTVNSTS